MFQIVNGLSLNLTEIGYKFRRVYHKKHVDAEWIEDTSNDFKLVLLPHEFDEDPN